MVAVLVLELELAAHCWVTGDQHAMAAVASRPLRRQVIVEARDVLDDDGRASADDAAHLEAQRCHRSGFDGMRPDPDRLDRGSLLIPGVYAFQGDSQPFREQVHAS